MKVYGCPRLKPSILVLTGRLGLILAACVTTAGCAAQLEDQQPIPESMQFDPVAVPPRVPQPTILLVNDQTHHLDFSLAGQSTPSNCQSQTTLSIAQCDFQQYLESLDGFPIDMPALAPSSAALDSATTLAPRNVLAVDVAHGNTLPAIDVDFDSQGNNLTAIPSGGWDVGAMIYVAVRGYELGVRAVGGSQVVASIPYFLFKQPSSLTCGASSANALSDDCPFKRMLSGGDSASQFAQLDALESVRSRFDRLELWQTIARYGGLPKDEVAVAWAFPTHSASVAPLNPSLNMVPTVVGTTELRIAIRGTLAPATVRIATLTSPGSALLLDTTALQNKDLANGMPAATASYEQGAIVLRANSPLVDGHDYAVLLTRALTDTRGVAFVASPVTVLLRGLGTLVDDQGKSTVSGVSDTDAKTLEGYRTAFKTLLDDPLFVSLTKVTRQDVVYVYGLSYKKP